MKAVAAFPCQAATRYGTGGSITEAGALATARN
jgi:hypothetical protein